MISRIKNILVVIAGMLLLFGAGVSGAEKLKIEIVGNRALDDDDWKNSISVKRDSTLDFDSLNGVLNKYRSIGYYNVSIDSVGITGMHSAPLMKIYVTEGEAVIIDTVRITGTDAQEKLIDVFGIYRGDRFIGSEVEDGIDRIIEWYESRGYPFCSVDIAGEELHGTDSSVNLTVMVSEGTPVMVDTIAVEGNKFTRRNFIIRESGLKTGQLFKAHSLELVSRRFGRHDFIELDGLPELATFQSSKNGVLLKVKEKSSNYFSGLLGYVPKNVSGGNKKSQINGFVDVVLGNLFGTGRRIAVKWENRGGYSQDMNVEYSEPYVFGSPLMLAGSFAQSVQDSTYLKRNFGIECEVSLYSSFSGLLSFGYESTVPEDYGREVYNLQKTGMYFWKAGVTYDSRDSRLNPRKGIYYSTFYSVGKRNNYRDDVQQDAAEEEKSLDTKITFDSGISVPAARKSSIYMRIYGAQIFSDTDDIPFSQLFPLGGARSLRGYKEKQFWGSAVGLVTLEYRYLMGRDSRIFAFYDGGYVKNGGSSFYKSGFGFGFRISSKIGLIGFDYGIGEGDSPSQGKIHLGIQNYF